MLVRPPMGHAQESPKVQSPFDQETTLNLYANPKVELEQIPKTRGTRRPLPEEGVVDKQLYKEEQHDVPVRRPRVKEAQV